MKKMSIRIWFPIVAIFLFGLIIGSLFLLGHKDDTMTIGVVLTGEAEDSGWNGNHYQGAKEACKEAGAKLILRENVPEEADACCKAIEELIKEGANTVLLTSYGYILDAQVQALCETYKEIDFFTNSFEVQTDNVAGFFPRMYEARYLSGVLAGMQTKSNIIGYVASKKAIEVYRGINAFTLGVQAVNQEAKVVVKWTDSWQDEEKEKEATRALVKAGADILSYHHNLPYVAMEAERLGVDYIAYHHPPDNFSDHCLTTVGCDWKLVYLYLLKEAQSNHEKLDHLFWFGVESETIGLSDYSDNVSAESIAAIEEYKLRLIQGADVFQDDIYDSNHIRRCAKGEHIGDSVLLEQMDWLVEGVVTYE